MNMKLSYRDKVIFIVAIVIIILVAGFFLFIRPKFAEIETAQANFEAKQQERTELDERLATLPTVIDNIKAMASEVAEKQDLFFLEQEPFQNENYVREIVSSVNGLTVISANTNYTTASAIEKYNVEQLHILTYDNKMNADLYNELPQKTWDVYNGVVDPADPNTIIGVTTMEIGFTGGFDIERIYSLLDKFAEDDKALILNTIGSAEENPENPDESEYTAVLTLYSVYPLNIDEVMNETAEIKPIEAAPAENAETSAAQ